MLNWPDLGQLSQIFPRPYLRQQFPKTAGLAKICFHKQLDRLNLWFSSQPRLVQKKDSLASILRKTARRFPLATGHYSLALSIDVILLVLILVGGARPTQNLISPLLMDNLHPLTPLTQGKSQKEVFGFAPHWTLNKLDNIDFSVLTTLAYFGVDVDGEGRLDKSGNGYETFMSRQATDLFRKAHASGTRVVLTVTQMTDEQILTLMDSEPAQSRAIDEIVAAVRQRGIDGINVDMEYTGDPGQYYRDRFSDFIANLAQRMHQEIPASKVTVSVYASAVKDPKIYDIKALGRNSDGIFMMAYDFAVAGSDNAIPTDPLYGHQSGKYWYDIASAVNDFLSRVSPDKIILGVPYYGYNYAVEEPEVKAATLPYWYGSPATQTYSNAQASINPDMPGIDGYKEGWDPEGQVPYKAYFIDGVWRMIFLDDTRSLSLKYDFAIQKKLAGVGIWALGFDHGKRELWDVLAQKFGIKLADASVLGKPIGPN